MPITVETDTNNEFDWATRTTDELTLFGRTMIDVTTLYDDGHIEETYSLNGVLITQEIQDPTDVFDFENQLTRYDTSGVLQFIDTLGDDAQREVQNFENGTLDTIVLTDESDTTNGPGTLPWNTITITFNTDGTVDERVINYDQNTGFFLPISDQQESNFLYEILYDADDTNDWLFIDNSRSGTSNTITTYYDHGGVREEIFRNGIADRISEDDYGNAEIWTGRTTLFDANGLITTRFTSNDDGSTFVESYIDGGLYLTTYQDNDSSNSVISVSISYDSEGNAVSQDTLLTNGETVTEILRETSIQIDTDEIANWDRITTVQDGEGTLIERETIFDNGNTRFDSFDNGVLSERLTTQADGDLVRDTYAGGQRVENVRIDVSDSVNWEEQTSTFDANGDLSTRTTIFDNGNTRADSFESGVLSERLTTEADGDLRFDTYENGQRVSNVRTDVSDSVSWEEQTSTFDANGDLSNRTTTYDDGVLRVETFEDGQRVSLTQTDLLDARTWDSIAVTYDENGAISQRVTDRDNGIRREELFEGGERYGIIEEDVFDFVNWDVKMTLYDADGNVEQRATLFDNNDEAYRIYEDGVLQALIQSDGNDSHSWGARLIEYTPDGPVTTVYDNVYDLPEPYIDFFAMAAA